MVLSSTLSIQLPHSRASTVLQLATASPGPRRHVWTPVRPRTRGGSLYTRDSVRTRPPSPSGLHEPRETRVPNLASRGLCESHAISTTRVRDASSRARRAGACGSSRHVTQPRVTKHNSRGALHCRPHDRDGPPAWGSCHPSASHAVRRRCAVVPPFPVLSAHRGSQCDNGEQQWLLLD